MELLIELGDLVVLYTQMLFDLIMQYASPFKLEIIVGLFLGTFLAGFIYGCK